MMPYSMMQQQQHQQRHQQPQSKYEEEAAAASNAALPTTSLGPTVVYQPSPSHQHHFNAGNHLQSHYLSSSSPNNNFGNASDFIAPTNFHSNAAAAANFSSNFNNNSNSNNLVSSASLLSPFRHEALANYQSGILSPSTPPVSRQRRHSKMHLRIASVDQQGESGNYGSFLGEPAPTSQPTATSFGSPSKAITSQSAASTGVKSGTTSSSASGGATAVIQPAAKPVKERYRIVILGSSAVGKTAIVEQFLYGSFPETHCCTVEELHKGEYEIAGGQVVPLEILDTSGSFTFTAMRNLAIANGDAFALVYSIDSPESWEEVKTIRELILQLKGSEPSPPPIVVVGNKADLPEERRQVKLEVAECECIDWESGFVECSAKNNKNIVNIFSCMLIQARLKGSLNVDSILASNSSRHIGYRDPASRAQRRRSSLPISELFHRSSRSGDRSGDRGGGGGGGGGGGLDSINRIADPRTSGTFRKRNSCTPS